MGLSLAHSVWGHLLSLAYCSLPRTDPPSKFLEFTFSSSEKFKPRDLNLNLHYIFPFSKKRTTIFFFNFLPIHFHIWGSLPNLGIFFLFLINIWVFDAADIANTMRLVLDVCLLHLHKEKKNQKKNISKKDICFSSFFLCIEVHIHILCIFFSPFFFSNFFLWIFFHTWRKSTWYCHSPE